MDFSISELPLNFVETLQGFSARAAFSTPVSSSVFREDTDMVPTIVDDGLSYVPWGGDNLMFNIIRLIEKDETLATCQLFNAEVCYGTGLQYCIAEASASVKNEVEDFLLDNDIAACFLGVSQDFKHFGFAVSVLILNEEGTKIVRLLGKEACYCRFAPADESGRIPSILYANWRKCVSSRNDIEVGAKYWVLEKPKRLIPFGQSGQFPMAFPDSNEIRQLRDVCIFEVNGMDVFP